MKTILLILTACAAVLAGPVHGQQTPTYRFTLENCLDYALRNNYRRQSLKLSEESTQAGYEQSKLNRIPSLNASASEGLANSDAGSAWTGSYGVSAGVTLFNGGAVNTTIEQSRLSAEQSGHVTSQYENALTVEILQAFLNVLGNAELLKYQDAVVEASAEQVKQGKAQLDAGQILESDYLLLEAQLANDQNNISDTRIARDKSLLILKALLSMNPFDELQVISPDTAVINAMSFIPGVDLVIERAINTLPDLKISQYSVDIATTNVKLSKAGYYPSLTMSAGLGSGYTGGNGSWNSQVSDRFNQNAGVSLSVPIFNNGSTRTKVTQSRIALKQAELDQKQTLLDMIQEVTNEYQDVVAAWNKYKTTDVRQNAYLKSFEAYRVQFENDAITPVDLLQQQNNYISALNDYIQSKYGFMLKRKILDVFMGVPVTM